MAFEKQTHWHGLIALHLFLAAAGSGLFLVNFALNTQSLYLPLVKIALIVGPVLVAIDTIFLVMDVGVKTKALQVWTLVKNLKASWMSRGVISIVAFVILGLVYSVPALWLDWWYARLFPLGVIAAIFALLIPIYTASLVGTSKGVPFWNSPVLPPLFILSALLTGIALSFFIVPYAAMRDTAAALHNLLIASMVLIVLEIMTLYGYLELGRRGNISSGESVHLMVTGTLSVRFWVVLGAIGLVIPFILAAFSLPLASHGALSTVTVLSIVDGVLLLVGGYFLRDLILRAGVYVSLYSMPAR